MLFFMIWYLSGVITLYYLCKEDQGYVRIKDIFIILVAGLMGFIACVFLVLIKYGDEIKGSLESIKEFLNKKIL
jgi:hypothetical protein